MSLVYRWVVRSALLIEHELSTVEDPDLDHSVALLDRLRAKLEEREQTLARQEAVVESVRRRLRALESELNARAARQRSAPVASAYTKPSRNDPCPCGSGRKFKICHGAR